MSKSEIPRDAGKRPPFASDPARDAERKAGRGEGYSGQEYNNAAQRDWRERQRGLDVAPTGEASGSGVGAGGGNMLEEFDADAATGGGERPREGD